MRFIKRLTFNFKSVISIVFLLAISGFYLNSFASYIKLNYASISFNLTAEISVDETSICEGETTVITFEGSGGTAPYLFTYTIDGEAQTPIESDNDGNQIISFDGNTIGSFEYELIAIKEKSSSSDPVSISDQEITIEVNSPPAADFSIDNDNVCSGENVTFTNNSSGEGDLTYEWNFGDGTTSEDKDASHVFEVIGCGVKTFDVILTVTDKNGCSSSETKQITVKEKPKLQFRDAKTKRDIFSNCDNTSSSDNFEITVEDIANTNCISSFYVDWGDGSNSSNVTFPADHTYSEIGEFTMKIKGTGVNGCENEVSYRVINDSNPAAGLENPGGTKNICTNDGKSSITFGISGFESNSLETTYEIDFGDGTPIKTLTQLQLGNDPDFTEEQLTHKFEKSSCSQTNGEFIVTLYVKNACDITTNTTDSIVILGESEVEFDAVDNTCINTPVLFENKSIIGDGIDCFTNADVTWSFDKKNDPDFTEIQIKFFSVNTAENITYTFTEAGIYNATLSVDTQCGVVEFSKEICIVPEISPEFTLSEEDGCIPMNVITANTTEESDLCSDATYEWSVSYSSDNCGDSSDWNYINGTDENSENPEFVFNTPGKYTLTQKITTGCGTATSTKVINVKKPPLASINSISDSCGITTINPVGVVENCTDNDSGITYNWSFPGGNPSSSTTLNPGDIVYDTPGVYEVSLEVTSECGVSNKAIETFEVFEKPVITNTNLTQEICSGQNTSEIIFETDNSNTTFIWQAVSSGNISGFITSGDNNQIPSQILINNGNTTETVTYTVVPKLATCEGAAVDFVVTVNPAPTITSQPVSSEICLNGAASPLEVAYDKGTGTPAYQWFNNTTNSNSGGTAIDGETSNTYAPPTNNVGEIFYYAVISFSSGGCSEIVSNTASVNVKPQITVAPIAAPQTLCVGGTADALEVSFSGGTGTPSYQWFSNNSNNNTGGTLIAGATNSTYTPEVFNTVGTFYFYAEISLNGDGCSTALSDAFEITVISDPVIDVQPIAAQELCQNSTPTALSVTVSGGTTSAKTYQWYANTTNSNTGGTPIPSANSSQYTPTTDNVGEFYYYVVISQTESDCSVTSIISELKVNEAPTFTAQPTSSEVCLDGAATLLEVEYENGTGTPSYQWFTNTTNSNSGGTAIDGETSNTYAPPTNNVGEIFYYAVISFSSGGCSEIVSNTASVNVKPQITVAPIAAPQTLCVGGTADALEVSFSGGTGAPSYQWFSNNSNNSTGGTPIAGATNNTYTPEVFNTVGTFYFYAEISLNGDGCSTALSDAFEITVISDPVIDVQPIATQELCQNSTPTALSVTVSGGTTSAKTYQWYTSSTNSIADGIPISGETLDTYSPSTDTVGTFYYYVIVSQVESDCSVTSIISELVVNEAPTFTAQPTSSEVCLDGAASPLEVAYDKGTGTPAYQWFTNTINSNSGGTAIAGETSNTYTPPTNNVGEIFYYAVISFSSGGCSEIVSNTASVNVKPQITIAPIAALQTLCVGGTADALEVSFSGGTGTPSYQWFSNNSNNNTGGTPIAGATNNTYTPEIFNTVGTFYFYAEISLNGDGCSTALSDAFEITVISDPVIDVQPIATQELCQNSTPTALSVTVSGGTTSAKTYQWYANTTNSNTGGTPIPSANSSQYTPTTDNVGEFYYYVVISQTESDCSVTSAISILKVNEAPEFTKQPNSSEICLNGAASPLEVAYDKGTGTPAYQWFTNTTNSNFGGTAIAGETSSTYAPPTNNVGEIFYYAVISFSSGGCSEIVSNAASVIINEIPIINDAEITIYSEGTFNFDPFSNVGNTVPNGTKYTWPEPSFTPVGGIIGASATASPQDNISQMLENTGTSAIVVTYIITPATTSCTGDPFILKVTVNPNISSNAVVTNLNCFESNDGKITTTIEGGVPFTAGEPYLISWSGPNGYTSADADISNLSSGIYFLKIEDSTGFSITEEWYVTQPNLLTITSTLEKNISCFQGADGAIEVTITGGTMPYTYNWSTLNGSGILLNEKNQNALKAGTYTLEIIDKNNCTTSADFVLTEPEGLEIVTTSIQDILCFGEATGAIELDVTGGTKIEVSPGVFDYIYRWSGPNGYDNSSKNINNVIAGTYTISITDELGCTTSKEIIISESPEIEISYTKQDVSCYGDSDGAFDVTATGGVAPYNISWSNLGNGFSQSNLTAGIYVATISDGNNCEKQVTIAIEQPIFFIEPDVKPISCNGENDGSIDLNLTGGVAPISVVWDDNSSAGLQRNNLSPGTYTVLITDSDSKQCPIEQSFTFINPPAMAVTSAVTDAIDCDIENSGSINLTVTGGTLPYTFLWSNGETTEDLENISRGEYNVEIKDANGCVVNRSFSIFRQDPLEIEFVESFITDCETKTVTKKVTAAVTGGFLPHTLSWASGTISGSNNEILTTTQLGAYELRVTDDKGCVKTKSILINNIPNIGEPDFRYDSFAQDNYDYLSINDPIQFTNLSTGNYKSVIWDFGDDSPTVNEENPIHTYDSVGNYTVKLTVEYDTGCIYTFERAVNITIGYKLINPNAFTPNGDGYNETVRPNFKGFTEVEMNIYNSWGLLIYYEKGATLKGWDGTVKNTPVENGNYIMVVKGITFYNKTITTSTPITLLK